MTVMPVRYLKTRAAVMAVCLGFACNPALATDQAVIDQINDLVSQGEKLIAAGRRAEGIKLVYQANDIAYNTEEDGILAGLLPNLAIARDELAQKNYARVETYAASVANAMDVPEFTHHLNRTEALMLMGISLAEQKKYSAALTVLQSAMRNVRDDPKAAKFHDTTLLYLARMASAVKSKDATDLRREAFETIDGANPALNQPYFCYLMYSDLNARWLAGERGQTIVDDAGAMVEYAKSIKGMRASSISYYTGFYALSLTSVKRYEEARDLLAQRRAYLLKNFPKSSSVLWNAQRLAAVLRSLKQYDESEVVLKDTIALGETAKSPNYKVIAKLQRDLGHLAKRRDQIDLAQDYFRQAYVTMRRVVGATDPNAVQIRKYINIRAEGFSEFVYSVEIAGNEAIRFTPREDGSDILKFFLQGNFQINEQIVTVRARKDTGKTREFWLNVALNDALIGRQKEALEHLEQARTEPTGEMASDAIYIDFTEAVALIWSTANRPTDAQAVLDRLAARADLKPSEKRLLAGLQASHAMVNGHTSLAIDAIRDWQAAFKSTVKPRRWDYLSALMIVEAAYWALSPSEAEAVYASVSNLLVDKDNLILTREILEMTRMAYSSVAAEGREGLLELGTLIKSLQGHVPPTHLLQVSSRFQYATALQRREQNQAALAMMQSAISKYGSDPYRREDIMAFLVSMQTRILTDLKQGRLATSVAKEAYAMIDIDTARGDLAVVVASAYIYQLVDRKQLDLAKDTALRFIYNPRFMARLDPADQVQILTAYSRVLVERQEYEQAQVVFEQALTVLPDDESKFAAMKSDLLFFQASGFYQAGKLAEAFDKIHLSNVVYQRLQADRAAAVVGEIDVISSDFTRVQTEAVLGWEYALTLPN